MICFDVIAVAHGWNMWRVFRRECYFHLALQYCGEKSATWDLEGSDNDKGQLQTSGDFLVLGTARNSSKKRAPK